MRCVILCATRSFQGQKGTLVLLSCICGGSISCGRRLTLSSVDRNKDTFSADFPWPGENRPPLADFTVVTVLERVTVLEHMVTCIVFIPRKEKLLRERWGACHVSAGLRRIAASSSVLVMVVTQPQGQDGAAAPQQRLGAGKRGGKTHVRCCDLLVMWVPLTAAESCPCWGQHGDSPFVTCLKVCPDSLPGFPPSSGHARSKPEPSDPPEAQTTCH